MNATITWNDLSTRTTDDIIQWIRDRGVTLTVNKGSPDWRCTAIIPEPVEPETYMNIYRHRQDPFRTAVADPDCRTAVLRVASVVWQANNAQVDGFNQSTKRLTTCPEERNR